jgi:hypothetical protein
VPRLRLSQREQTALAPVGLKTDRYGGGFSHSYPGDVSSRVSSIGSPTQKW